MFVFSELGDLGLDRKILIDRYFILFYSRPVSDRSYDTN